MAKAKSPNSTYYRNKADTIFMARYRGLPCEICGTEEGTGFHHVVGKSRSKSLRYDDRNGIILCQAHHTWGTDMAPHSVNSLAVERFHNWFRIKHPDRWQWLQDNEHVSRRFTYKQAGENLLIAGKEAWE